MPNIQTDEPLVQPQSRPNVIVASSTGSGRAINLPDDAIRYDQIESLFKGDEFVPGAVFARRGKPRIVFEIVTSNNFKIGVFERPVHLIPIDDNYGIQWLWGYALNLRNHEAQFSVTGLRDPKDRAYPAGYGLIYRYHPDSKPVSLAFTHSAWNLGEEFVTLPGLAGEQKHTLISLDTLEPAQALTNEHTFVKRFVTRRWPSISGGFPRGGGYREFFKGTQHMVIQRWGFVDGQNEFPWDRPADRIEVMNGWRDAKRYGLFHFPNERWPKLREVFLNSYLSDLDLIEEDKTGDANYQILREPVEGHSKRITEIRREVVFLDKYVGTLIKVVNKKRVGGRLLHEFNTEGNPDHPQIWVVSVEPLGLAACYFYHNKEAAIRWTSGEMTYDEVIATRPFVRRVPHAGEWRPIVEEEFAAQGVLPDPDRVARLKKDEEVKQ